MLPAARTVTSEMEVHVDNLISTGCFKKGFSDSFGPVACFRALRNVPSSVFRKPTFDLVVRVVTLSEIAKVTGALLGFVKTPLKRLQQRFSNVF